MSASQQFIQESVTTAIGLIAIVKLFLDHAGKIDCVVKIDDDPNVEKKVAAARFGRIRDIIKASATLGDLIPRSLKSSLLSTLNLPMRSVDL